MTTTDVRFDQDHIGTSVDGPTVPQGEERAAAPDGVSSVDRLKDWAHDNRVGDDPYVSALESAAAAGDLGSMADVDPLDALPQPAAASPSRQRRAARIVNTLRNVAIFLPVALTWLGIRQASAAFGRFTTDADSAVGEVSFLQFWQTGGPPGGPDYLASEWRIGTIALSAALIVLAVIVLTLVGSWLSGSADRADDRRMAVVDRERTAVAVALSRDLRRAGTARALHLAPAPELVTAIDGLASAAGLVAASAVRLEQATMSAAALGSSIDVLADRCCTLSGQVDALGGRFSDLDAGLDRVGDRVEAIGGHITDGGSRLAGAVAALGRFERSVGVLQTKVDGDVGAALLEAISGIDDVRVELARTSASIEFGTGRLREDLDAIHAGLVEAGAGAR